ncbi:hypothetical protein BGX23_009544, partial [Mortierella sp. AD031]
TFKELGAPDLCHIIKVNVKPAIKETSSYHYVSGIDASSSASLAAYLNSLTYAIDESHAWFSKGAQWRIRSGVYCCYNAFSRVDVRVEVKIPGGVESYAINVRGERQEATAAIWQETYITAMLRSILYSDDANYRIPGFRKLDPIPDESFRYDLAVQFFERLYRLEPEVASLLAQSYIGTDEELKAINVLYDALKQLPQSYALLHVQADFLRGKGKLEMALRLAKQAVNLAPSEFITWAKLTEVYIDLGDYESALLTLNSCPMFTFSERDLQRMPKAAKAHLPIRSDIDLSLIDDETGREHEASLCCGLYVASGWADPALLRLPAPSLRGTFSSAYNLLTRLVSKIGWDELLRCRSLVFVMEEEYRMQKEAEESMRKGSQAKVMAHHDVIEVPDREQLLSPNGTPIPIIKISTESEREREQEEAEEEARTKAVEAALEKAKEENAADENGEPSMEDIKLDDLSIHSDKDQDQVQDQDKDQDGDEAEEKEDEEIKADEVKVDKADIKSKHIEKPTVAAASSDDEDNNNEEEEVELSFSFSNKRLCDRWLDNLFMVLYEDLRQYTIWRAEVQHFRAVQAPYRKSGTDWEIYGDLATRLHHREEAKDAYQRCAEQKFSAKALLRLLEIYSDEGNLHRAMEVAIKLCVYQERWYHETIFPTAIAHNLNKLIQSEGLAKVQNTLIAVNASPAVFKLMSRYLTRAKTFDVPGSGR